MGRDDEFVRSDGSPRQDETRSSFDRREVLAGFAASSALGLSPAAAQNDTGPRIQIVRHPRLPQIYGVGIVLPNVESAKAPRSYALFPKVFASESWPQGWRGNQRATDELNRFVFKEMKFSKETTPYQLEFLYTVKDRTIAAKLTREGGKAIPSSSAPLGDVLAGTAGLVFGLPIADAEWLRRDLFGERVEIIGKSAKLTLNFQKSELQPPFAEWIEPELRLTLEPEIGGQIYAFEKSVSVRKLTIRRADGNDGDGARRPDIHVADNWSASVSVNDGTVAKSAALSRASLRRETRHTPTDVPDSE